MSKKTETLVEAELEQIKLNFDWKYYVSHNKLPFNTKVQAWHHFKKHGYKEGNLYKFPKDNKILVMMPTYNRSENIIKVIKMLLDQSYTNWDFLIIDDGSTSIHKRIFCNIKRRYNKNKQFIFLENETNCHIGKTLNRGIKYFLDNDYDNFTWISDDNEYYPNYLQELVIDNNYFTYSQYNVKINNTIKLNDHQYKTMNDLLNKWFGCASFMWTKEAIKEIGFYKEDIYGCEDYEYLLRTFQKNSIQCNYVSKPLMAYIDNNDSLTSKNKEAIRKLHSKIRNEYKQLVTEPLVTEPLVTEPLVTAPLVTAPLVTAPLVTEPLVTEPLVTEPLVTAPLVTKIKKPNKDNYDISIVMAYMNRKEQTLKTLDGFEKQYANNYDFEVVIVDDNSNDENKIDTVIQNYSFPINLIVISEEEKGTRINPCSAYNRGFKEAKGKIIIIQNPECYHVGDIVGYTRNHLTENEYYSYSCYTANSFEITKELINSSHPYNLINDPIFNSKNYNIIDLSWYNHPTEPDRQTAYHFCSAIYKSKLDLIGGFDERFADGYCFDDDELLLSIKYNLQLDIKIIDPKLEVLVIHQHHKRNDSFNICSELDTHPIKKKWLKNKKLYEEMKAYHESKQFNYPKLLHLYWDGSPLAFLNFITVLSFNEYHKFWKINVFIPTQKTDIITWKTHEQKLRYIGNCHFHKLHNIPNVFVHKVDLDKIGFYNDASEVIKSDYFRYYILQKHGGLWSDFDIIYTASVEDKMNFEENTVIFHCTGYHDTENSFIYYPIGLFLSKKNNVFFNYILDKCNVYYDSSRYQSIGATMFNTEFENYNYVYKIDSVKILDNTYYLPWQCNELHFLFNKNNRNNTLPQNNVGIHWFNGSDEAKHYSISLDNKLNKFIPLNYIDSFVQKYISNVSYDIIIYYCNQTHKIINLLENFKLLYNNIINLHIISDNIIDNINLYNNINIKYYNDINCAVNNINNEFIFFQDLIVVHKSNVFDTMIHEISSQDNDFVGCNKTIENDKLSDSFKETIKKNKIPDIILFKKQSYLNNKFKINETWNKYCKYTLLETEEIEYFFPKNIPKIIHFYWDGSKGDYLTSLSIKSFVFNNPNWSVIVWMPRIKCTQINTWEVQENIPPHTMPYNDIDFIDYNYLTHDLGVEIKNIEYFNLGLNQNFSEIIKSDIFRWKILYEIGGVWSDMDILFVDRIEKTDLEKCKTNFNDIELVVSQYQRTIPEAELIIDFYYIGFLMSSKNNLFFKIMYDEALKNVNSSSYQGVGGDLMKSHFGLFDNIGTIINNNKYANLQSDSVYHYWWLDLRNMYLNNIQENVVEYSLKHNNIIGYHWFRGVHLSRIYTHFYNYENKIQNYNSFNGPLNSWSKYYEQIFNEPNVITIQKKISIVMGYINRVKQLEITLTTISKSLHTNYEIIIVNDGDEDLTYLHDKFNNLKIINNSHKQYINPCLSYNIGIEASTGDIIILQNPECCHVGDLLTTVNCLLKENDYMAFSSYYLDNYDKNELLYPLLLDDNNKSEFWNVKKIHNILQFTIDTSYNSVLPKKNKGWSSHHFYNQNYLHFCTAIYKSKLINLKCFSDEYKDGICFDDDDLVRKIKLGGLNMYYYPISQTPSDYPALCEYSVFVIHQHHDRFAYTDPNIKKKWEINKQLFISDNYKYVKNYIDLFKNKIISYDVNVNNGKIIDFNDNIYKINFNKSENSIILDSKFPMNTFEYYFNGKTMFLQNNIKELFNNCDFELNIYCSSLYNINCNGVILNADSNDNYIYIGKMNNGQFILTNLPKIINISFICRLKYINFIDNTVFKLLQ